MRVKDESGLRQNESTSNHRWGRPLKMNIENIESLENSKTKHVTTNDI